MDGATAGRAEEPFDLEGAIAAFLADESANSLELPHTLTPEQRKHARKLSDAHPSLKCESYGFGADRRLHLFKQGSPKPTANSIGVIGQDRPPGESSVRVKNTFIDDWVPSEEVNGSSEPLHCRSTPTTLLQRTLQRCLVEAGDSRELPLVVEDAQTSDGTSVGEGPQSPHGSASLGLDMLSLSGATDLPLLPDGLQVRNTFIHIETLPTINRIVQSMPDGMFRQCLEAELFAQHSVEDGYGAAASEAVAGEPTPPRVVPAPHAAPVAARAHASVPLGIPPAPAAAPVMGLVPTNEPTTPPPASSVVHGVHGAPVPASPPPADAPCTKVLATGTEVEIEGLVKLPDFNGLTGTVQSFDAETGRYDVYLDHPTGACGWRWVKVKDENLKKKTPPPPRKAPTLSIEADDEQAVPAHQGHLVPPTPTWEEDFHAKSHASIGHNFAAR